RRRGEPHRWVTVVEEEGLVPEVAPHGVKPPSYPSSKNLGHVHPERLQARPARRSRLVRRALHHTVDVVHHVLRRRREPVAGGHQPGGVPPRRVVGRPVGQCAGEAGHERVEAAGVDGDAVLAGAPDQDLRVVGPRREVRVREPGEAAVVEHGHVPVAAALAEGDGRHGGEAGRAPGAVGVAAAEREAPDRVRAATPGRRGGEARGGVGRDGGQRGEHGADVAVVGGVGGVGAAVV
ncbi:Os10g0327201, partial [Oryza sativa Japonica Group]